MNAIRLHPRDNISIAVRDLTVGDAAHAGEQSVTITQAIPMGHKVAIAPIQVGQAVHKFGQIIGFATSAIEPGQWVHTHNLGMGDVDRDYAMCSEAAPVAIDPQLAARTFMGYRRPALQGAGARFGTRNYIAVVATVNCSATVCKAIAQRFTPETLADYSNIDGVIAVTHQTGCGMAGTGLHHEYLTRVLRGLARHVNIGGVLIVGLGCEVNTAAALVGGVEVGAGGGLVQVTTPMDARREVSGPVACGDGGWPAAQGPPILIMQDVGGTAATIEVGARRVAQMLGPVNDIRREPAPISQLTLATECGGSDGASGVTANPALGVAADTLIRAGGTAILAETTEIYGAEHLLTRRAATPEVAQALLDRIAWWKRYTAFFDVKIDNNPSPGNKAGGLTTIYEKSLGAVAKGGTTQLNAVYQYAQPVVDKGFVFMDTPGYDPPSVTGMVAGGANVVCFTTGRGSCFGCKPAPSIKIATNTPMFQRMQADMDINAGAILQGRGVAEVGAEIFEAVIATASGQPTKSETLGVGDEEFVPWYVGPVL